MAPPNPQPKPSRPNVATLTPEQRKLKREREKRLLERWIQKYGTLRALPQPTIDSIKVILTNNYGSLRRLFRIEVTPGGMDVPMTHRGENEATLILLLGGLSTSRDKSELADYVLEWMEIEIRAMNAREEERRRRKALGFREKLKENVRSLLEKIGVVKKEWDRKDLEWEGPHE